MTTSVKRLPLQILAPEHVNYQTAFSTDIRFFSTLLFIANNHLR
jgi:hypothetical protein